ncbi:MAG: hypothetical protein JSC085_000221 [Candidatus Tokpelaia sp. JSC085]|nr:MAG: hypothetical protein JSC085_000221 [Candidatus Tokpelaia sp. JSC085]
MHGHLKNRTCCNFFLYKLVIAICSGIMAVTSVQAKRLSSPVAVFSGLDKITGRIVTFEIPIDGTYQFGTLQITPRVCYTSSEDEPPRTDGFVEVNEMSFTQNLRRIFTGWMFTDSPGLNAVEHPVYDVWLKDCKSVSDLLPAPSIIENR